MLTYSFQMMMERKIFCSHHQCYVQLHKVLIKSCSQENKKLQGVQQSHRLMRHTPNNVYNKDVLREERSTLWTAYYKLRTIIAVGRNVHTFKFVKLIILLKKYGDYRLEYF